MSWRQGQTAILTQVLLIIAALLSHLSWVTEGPKPSGCRWFSIRHLVSNWVELHRAPGYIIVSAVLPLILLSPLFFHSFTQVHLLIDGSVEGQYIIIRRRIARIGMWWKRWKNRIMNDGNKIAEKEWVGKVNHRELCKIQVWSCGHMVYPRIRKKKLMVKH